VRFGANIVTLLPGFYPGLSVSALQKGAALSALLVPIGTVGGVDDEDQQANKEDHAQDTNLERRRTELGDRITSRRD
jgi:hypothetical protein